MLKDDNFWGAAAGMPPVSPKVESLSLAENVLGGFSVFVVLFTLAGSMWFGYAEIESLLMLHRPTDCAITEDSHFLGIYAGRSAISVLESDIPWRDAPVRRGVLGAWRQYDALCQQLFGDEYNSYDRYPGVH